MISAYLTYPCHARLKLNGFRNGVSLHNTLPQIFPWLHCWICSWVCSCQVPSAPFVVIVKYTCSTTQNPKFVLYLAAPPFLCHFQFQRFLFFSWVGLHSAHSCLHAAQTRKQNYNIVPIRAQCPRNSVGRGMACLKCARNIQKQRKNVGPMPQLGWSPLQVSDPWNCRLQIALHAPTGDVQAYLAPVCGTVTPEFQDQSNVSGETTECGLAWVTFLFGSSGVGVELSK